MTKKTKIGLHVIVLPFAISASIEFLPAWIYIPMSLLLGMAWLGSCAMLREENFE